MSLFDLTILFEKSYAKKDITFLNNQINTFNKNNKYPPYNIKIVNNDVYIIEIALAGFKEEELSISLVNNHLIIKTLKISEKYPKYYLHKGIAKRNFEKIFKLANNVKIDKCFLNKGILNIPLQIQKPNKSKSTEIKIEIL